MLVMDPPVLMIGSETIGFGCKSGFEGSGFGGLNSFHSFDPHWEQYTAAS